VAIVSALASLCANRPVRSDTAMTGEITLSGLVFPVGGIKGKVLAARRAGMKRVVLPKRNQPDVKDIPEEALRDLEIFFVERIDEVLPLTLTPPVEGTTLPLPEAETVSAGTEASFESGEAHA
jgi:ATP-dependent Lon protease